MIIDERTYTVRPGTLSAYLKAHMAKALPLMRKYLGEPHGYYTTESGDLNQFVHLWHFDSMADHEVRRAAMYADAAWVAYRERTGEKDRGLHRYNCILKTLEVPT